MTAPGVDIPSPPGATAGAESTQAPPRGDGQGPAGEVSPSSSSSPPDAPQEGGDILRWPKGGTWRTDVHRRCLQILGPDQPEPAQVTEALKTRSVASWRSGWAEEVAHAYLDEHEVQKVPTDQGLTALARGLRVRVKNLLRSGNSSRVAALELLDAEEPSVAQVTAALRLLHDGWSGVRRAQRTQRNRNLALVVLFVVAAISLALLIDREVGELSLAPPPTTETDTTDGAEAPPGPGDTTTASPDEEASVRAAVANPWALVGLGAVGALVSLLALARRTPTLARTSGAWVAQALLKLSSGALLGLLACWVLQTGLIEAIEPLEAGPLAVWAVLFGYSQDALTKRFDERLAAAQPPARTGDQPAETDH